MTAAPQERLMTANELMALPDDGNVYELSQGVLICMSPSAFRSGPIAVRLAGRMDRHADQHSLGLVGVSESGFQLTRDPDTVRAPDVWFVRAHRVPNEEAQARYFQGAPDLAVEIVSPTDRFDRLMVKIREYLQAGAQLVWALDSGSRNTLIFRADGSYTFLGEDGVLDGEEVLPGFSLPLRDLFR